MSRFARKIEAEVAAAKAAGIPLPQLDNAERRRQEHDFTHIKLPRDLKSAWHLKGDRQVLKCTDRSARTIVAQMHHPSCSACTWAKSDATSR